METEIENSELVFENLTAFACSDGLDIKEEEFLYNFAEKYKIEKSKAISIIKRKGKIDIPSDTNLKRIMLNYMIDLAMADGKFSTEELNLCHKFVMKLGLDPSMMILTTKLLKALNKIDQQKNLIIIKNQEAKSSLEAAKRIQRAILPPEKHIKMCLPDSFVIYMPKDIVSGDFYWIEPICPIKNDPNEDVIFVSAVDCTGHGVPGAFMSLVGCHGLNRIVKEFGIVHPGEILKMLNRIVGENLHEDNNKDIKDGMDIALCVLNKKTRELEFAGARNSLYLVKSADRNLEINYPVDEEKTHHDFTHILYEIKGDKSNIGANEEEVNFKNHEIVLETGDVFYICSDGYVDQNGGPKDKKYSPQAFRKMLLDIQDLEMQEQKTVITDTIIKWMGDREQRDDIVVIGVRID